MRFHCTHTQRHGDTWAHGETQTQTHRGIYGHVHVHRDLPATLFDALLFLYLLDVNTPNNARLLYSRNR